MLSTIDDTEVLKFSQLAAEWWNKDGPLKTLHDINPVRMEFIKRHALLRDARVLDIGCGGGILCESLANEGAHVTGLDVALDVLVAARAHASESQLAIDYVGEPIEHYNSVPFDNITCMEMLEHVPHPELVVQQAARLLCPGGALFLSTINRTAKAYAAVILAAEYVLNLLPRQTHDYEKFIQPSELASMAREAGLEVVALAGVSYNPWSRHATLVESVAVNYLMVCRKVL